MLIKNEPAEPDPAYSGKFVQQVVKGNLFDGQVSYTHKGYNNGFIKVIIYCNKRIKKNYISICFRYFYIVHMKQLILK